jgi:hypothetical protein
MFTYLNLLGLYARRWKYELVVSMDGNFSLRLKHKKTKRNDLDKDLGSGWAYTVDDTAYREVLARIQAANPKAADVRSFTQPLFTHVLTAVIRNLCQHAALSSMRLIVRTHVAQGMA